MSILLVEQSTEGGDPLAIQIEKATGWPVTNVQSFQEGLKNLAALKSKIRIAVLTLDDGVETACQFIKEAVRLTAASGIECPRLLALSHTSRTPDIADRLERLDVQLLLRRYPEQILETVKKLQWQARATNGRPTIVIQRRAGHVVAVKVTHHTIVEGLEHRAAASSLG